METTFSILVALAVAMFAWGMVSLAMGLLDGRRRKVAERLSGKGDGRAAGERTATSIVSQGEAAGLPQVLARFAVMRGLQRQLGHAYPDMSVVKFMGISAGLALVALLVAVVLWDSLILGFVCGGLGAVTPMMAVSRRKNRRQRQLTGEL